ncbi:MAG TPA: lasso peptide biosynthesis B2 protein [Polyangiaceae bacterium]|nr:lasso peptide biosynthesis B2 protein [Polyangiaceae bacterium]
MRLRPVAELRAVEWLVLLQLIPLAGATKLALRRAPLKRLVDVLERLGRPSAPGFPLFAGAVQEHHLYRLADWATRVPGGNTPCLLRSLLLHLLLRRRGEFSAIAIGVMKDGAELRAHAWVTSSRGVLGESAATLAKFKPIAQLGTS